MTQWFEDESFWVDTYPFMFSASRFTAAEAEIDPLLRLVGSELQSILDLCCGPGRFAVPLARRGFRVTGVDRTAFFLDKARERAAAENVAGRVGPRGYADVHAAGRVSTWPSACLRRSAISTTRQRT